MTSYPYQGSDEQEYLRLLSLQKAYDGETIRQLEALGVARGWSCLEVGAGAGSIAAWMMNRVGENGRCVATDINIDFLQALNDIRLEIWRHDIASDSLPEDTFDLIHARFLLDVLPNRDIGIARMLDALKPGGWIMLEEFDALTSVGYSTCETDDISAFAKVQVALDQLWKQQGFDGEYGRKVAGEFHRLGLTEIGSVGHCFLRQGATNGVEPWRLSVERLRSAFVENGYLTTEIIDAHQSLLMNPSFFYFAPMRVIAWARKPL